MSAAYLLFKTIHFSALASMVYATGRMVETFNVKVNYSRKMVHFFAIFFPFFLKIFVPYQRTAVTEVMTALLAAAYFGLFIEPLRSRSTILSTMFRSIDRPEDRPYTIIWFVTQYLAGALVLLPLYFGLMKLGAEKLIFIPIIINGIGDGLAEPVGIRFGKHAYEVKALFTDKKYIRTWEGSACVFIVSVITLLCFARHFTAFQLLALLAVLPAAVTYTEAKSPHTWDSPSIYLVAGLLIVAAKLIAL